MLHCRRRLVVLPPRRLLVSKGRAPLSSWAGGAPPPSPDRAVGYWLLGCGGLVAGMVSVGGMTRLTKSGLSMTDWKVQGSLPPMNEKAWEEEFARYKQFPEWQQRQSMTMREFQTIYAWEYGHRMFGRVVGAAFVVPLAYFAARGRLKSFTPYATLLALGGTQGLVGWWMVKSGLEADPESRKEIRVSPYRLATHLGLAFTTYSLLVWTGLDALHKSTPVIAPPPPRVLAPLAAGCFGLVFATAMSGAFVAGNDAGRAFNTFPKMDGRWIPDGIATLTPLYRNLAENTATVQFDHRLLATASTTAVLALLATAAPSWSTLPPAFRQSAKLMGLALVAQVSLGISTLLLYVPTNLAAAHQLGSLLLLTTTIKAAHSLRGPTPVFFFSTPQTAVAATSLAGIALVGSYCACSSDDDDVSSAEEVEEPENPCSSRLS